MAKFSTKKLSKKVNKWWDSMSSWSGYKSNKTNLSNSSFWIDNDFLKEEANSSRAQEKANDIVKLAGYKRAISNFVRIVTGRNDIPVLFSSGRDSYTDGSQVVISAKLDENEFDPTVGLALHEGSHIHLTDFKYHQEYLSRKCENRFKTEYPGYKEEMLTGLIRYLKDLINVIEDRRIDNYIYKSAPGYKGYYHSLYDKYFNDESIDRALLNQEFNKQTWDDYLFHIVNFTNANRTLDILPKLRDIWNLIDIKNIDRLTNTVHVIDLAEQVHKIIYDQIKFSTESGSNGNSGDNESSNESSNDPVDVDKDDTNGGSDKINYGPGNGEDPNLDLHDSDPSAPNNAEASQGNFDAKEAKKLKKHQEALKKARERQQDFLDGKIKKKSLSRSEAAQVNAAAEAVSELRVVGVDDRNLEGINCVIMRGLTTLITDSGLTAHAEHSSYKNHWLKYELGSNPEKDYIQKGIELGTLLGKRLKTRDEERSLKTSRMEAGRIDKRLLAELGFGNYRVFQQVIHKTSEPACVHISIDASGSMSGEKWHSAMKTSVAIAKAASMINSLQCIISLRGTYSNGGNNAQPLMWIVYDSSKDPFSVVRDKFWQLKCNSSTPEGLCFEAIKKEIQKTSAGRNSYLINLSDGEPAFSAKNFNYHGHRAAEHTREQVSQIRKSGVQILSYFISRDSRPSYASSSEFFNIMYGADASYIDCSNLTQLARSLNGLFERGVE